MKEFRTSKAEGFFAKPGDPFSERLYENLGEVKNLTEEDCARIVTEKVAVDILGEEMTPVYKIYTCENRWDTSAQKSFITLMVSLGLIGRKQNFFTSDYLVLKKR